MAIKDKTFRPWKGRPTHQPGWGHDEWQRYFLAEEMHLFKAGMETPELRAERRKFWNYRKNEIRRLEKLKVREEKANQPEDTFRAVYLAPAYLRATRRVMISCARYWYFANVLPYVEGGRRMSREHAIKALGLSEEDAAAICIVPSAETQDLALASASKGEYPVNGFSKQQGKALPFGIGFGRGSMGSYEPPSTVLALIDPVHYSLGLSKFQWTNKEGQRAVYTWTADRYAHGEDRDQREVEALTKDSEDYRSKLLSIFD